MKKPTNLFRHFVVIAFSLIVAVTLLQVFMRYVLVAPLKWAEEFSRYVFVWGIMVSIAICCLEEGHMRLNMVTTKFGKKAQFIFYMVDQAIIFAFNIVLIIWGSQLAVQNMMVKSPAMKIPIGIAYGGIPAGAIVVVIFLILDSIRVIKAYKSEEISCE